MADILPFQALAVPAARIVEKLASRRDRDMQRGRRAADAVKRAGGSSLDAAMAHVDAMFGPSAAHNRLKLSVERAIRLGPGHPAVRARFGRRAMLLRGRTLAGAIALTEHCYREERRALQVAAAFGRGTRLSLTVLEEMRLMLRFARRRLTDQQFQLILAAVDACRPTDEEAG